MLAGRRKDRRTRRVCWCADLGQPISSKSGPGQMLSLSPRHGCASQAQASRTCIAQALLLALNEAVDVLCVPLVGARTKIGMKKAGRMGVFGMRACVHSRARTEGHSAPYLRC